MNTCKLTLAALLLGAAGACAAGVPVIYLAPSSGAASFAAYARGAAAMPLTAMGAGYGMLVAARPLPPFGAVLPLLLGSLVYLGRRRRHGLALRPAQTLRERLAHAPAYA